MSPHKAEACARLSPIGQRLFRFIEFDDNEELLAEIRKHPLGLFFVVATGMVISLLIGVATVALALNLGKLGVGTVEGTGFLARNIMVALGLLLAAFGIVATVVGAIIYRSSVVFITNEKIAEVVYRSIFNRRIMQLGIGNVEDVTVFQKGILPRLFDYGNMVVETAGELKNPAFTYVPIPQTNSRIIIEAHEEYVQKYGN
jgi:hypothetical protein